MFILLVSPSYRIINNNINNIIINLNNKRMEKMIKEGFEKPELEQYESPRMEVIEMEIEGPILQMSGEDSVRTDW